MGFLDKAKAAAEQAATRAREGVEEVQSKRSLSHAYEQLGQTAFELLESGEITHERLTGPAEEVRRLRSAGAAEADAPSAPPSEAPPAMPV